MLLGPDSLAVLHMLCDPTQADLFYKFPWHCNQADRPVVHWVLLTILFVDGSCAGKLTILWDLSS